MNANTINPSELRRLCSAFYGAAWQRRIAAEIDVHRVTVARWAAGTHPVPAKQLEDILYVCTNRPKYLRALLRDVKDKIKNPEKHRPRMRLKQSAKIVDLVPRLGYKKLERVHSSVLETYEDF